MVFIIISQIIFQFKYYSENGQKKSILNHYAFNFYKKEKNTLAFIPKICYDI